MPNDAVVPQEINDDMPIGLPPIENLNDNDPSEQNTPIVQTSKKKKKNLVTSLKEMAKSLGGEVSDSKNLLSAIDNLSNAMPYKVVTEEAEVLNQSFTIEDIELELPGEHPDADFYGIEVETLDWFNNIISIIYDGITYNNLIIQYDEERNLYYYGADYNYDEDKFDFSVYPFLIYGELSPSPFDNSLLTLVNAYIPGDHTIQIFAYRPTLQINDIFKQAVKQTNDNIGGILYVHAIAIDDAGQFKLDKNWDELLLIIKNNNYIYLKYDADNSEEKVLNFFPMIGFGKIKRNPSSIGGGIIAPQPGASTNYKYYIDFSDLESNQTLSFTASTNSGDLVGYITISNNDDITEPSDNVQK